jgi:hypothetical protein
VQKFALRCIFVANHKEEARILDNALVIADSMCQSREMEGLLRVDITTAENSSDAMRQQERLPTKLLKPLQNLDHLGGLG